MHASIKSLYSVLPKPVKYYSLFCYESYLRFKNREFAPKAELKRNPIVAGRKIKVLFFHISGLSFAGTERNLQILAKHLDPDKYEVVFMYSPKPRPQFFGPDPIVGRLGYFNGSSVRLLPFDYNMIGPKFPHVIHEMQPSFYQVLAEEKIDLIVSAGAGYAEYPINFVKGIPIIYLNIFGTPNAQSNIKFNVCISQEVANKILPTMPDERVKVMGVPTEDLYMQFKELGVELRTKLGIPVEAVVFGRIGRANDAIFDPIGIQAFKRLVKERPSAHYLIMAPPPILRTIVETERIPNVHFVEPSPNDIDVWAFHNAIDVVAHFRRDGESFGLNIVESMICYKPVITHRSISWNAHLEYLNPSCSFVAEIDDIEKYTVYMKALLDDEKLRSEMGEAARHIAEQFIISNCIGRFDELIEEALK